MSRILLATCCVAVIIGACTPSPRSDSDRSKPADHADYPIDEADSRPAQVKKPYRFVLATHCGIDWAIDFDGSFWAPTAEDARLYRQGRLDLREPSDRGTMTLLSDDRAVYRGKEGPVIDYVREEPIRPDPPLFLELRRIGRSPTLMTIRHRGLSVKWPRRRPEAH